MCVPWGLIYDKLVSSVSSNGMAPNRHWSIICISDGPVQWHMQGLPCPVLSPPPPPPPPRIEDRMSKFLNERIVNLLSMNFHMKVCSTRIYIQRSRLRRPISKIRMILLMDAKTWMTSLIIMFAVRPICLQDSIFKMSSESPDMYIYIYTHTSICLIYHFETWRFFTSSSLIISSCRLKNQSWSNVGTGSLFYLDRVC